MAVRHGETEVDTRDRWAATAAANRVRRATEKRNSTSGIILSPHSWLHGCGHATLIQHLHRYMPIPLCVAVQQLSRDLQLTQDEASANEGNRHTTSQPTDCSIPSSSLPTTFSACSARPHSVHRGDHGAASFSYSSSLPSSSSSSCSSSLSPSLSVVSMPLSSSSCSTTAFCFALAACCASAACSARS